MIHCKLYKTRKLKTDRLILKNNTGNLLSIGDAKPIYQRAAIEIIYIIT